MATSKAMQSHAVGGPESLTLDEIDIAPPSPGHVQIAVKAAGVNFPDTLIIRDLYQFKPPRPFAPGGEVAGEVVNVGEGVNGIKTGDRVLALCGHGGFSTLVNVPYPAIVKIPDAMPFKDAAGFVMTYGTSYYALKDRAALQAGESLFILGAAGGVGTAAIELAKAMGARVIAGVSSEAKAQLATDLGADDTLIYPKGALDRAAQKALSSAIKQAAGGEGVNVIYDAVGGDYAEPALRAMAWAGRYLVVGFPAGIPALPLNLTLLKSCQIMGVFWGAATMRDPAGHQQNMKDLFALYADKKIKPVVTKTLPLAEAGEALRMLEAREATGKIVLHVA
ncbi:MAG: NADPH:quinone oxidoreductase family protein [Pseudomonadota bacterium]